MAQALVQEQQVTADGHKGEAIGDRMPEKNKKDGGSAGKMFFFQQENFLVCFPHLAEIQKYARSVFSTLAKYTRTGGPTPL